MGNNTYGDVYMDDMKFQSIRKVKIIQYEGKKTQSSFLLRTYTGMDSKPGETTREQKTLTIIDSQEEEFSVTVH